MEHKVLPIPGYNGYFAASNGDIFSAWVTGSNPYIKEGKLRKLSPAKWPNGYLHVNIRVKKNTYYSGGVHRLVCLAFHGDPPAGYTTSHLNGNRQDNRSENLVWESLKDNHQRKIMHGTTDRGSKNSRALLDKQQIVAMKKELSGGKKTHQQIADQFGVNRVFVTKVNGGYRYKYD